MGEFPIFWLLENNKGKTLPVFKTEIPSSLCAQHLGTIKRIQVLARVTATSAVKQH